MIHNTHLQAASDNQNFPSGRASETASSVSAPAEGRGDVGQDVLDHVRVVFDA
jgi:hypothetical protein